MTDQIRAGRAGELSRRLSGAATGLRPRRMAVRGGDYLRGAAFIVLLLAIWQVLVTVMHPSQDIIVAPSSVARAFWDDLLDGVLGNALWISLKQFALGFGIAVLFCVPLGLVVGLRRQIRAYTDPWLTILSAAPIIALAPLFVVSLGLGLRAHVVIIAVSASSPIVVNTCDGVRAVKRELREVGYTFEASALETFWRIALPGAASEIFTGFRVGLGRGLAGLVVADFFGATGGIGYMLATDTAALRTSQVYVAVTLLALLGLGISVGLRLLQQKLMPWSEVAR